MNTTDIDVQAIEPGTPSGEHAASILAARKVRVGYDGTTVVHDVDLDVGEGAMTVLVGANGAGKSTLLRALSGRLRLQQGSVTYCGRDISRDRAHTRAKAGLCHIPEGRAVFKGLTVRENLLLQAPTRGRQAATDRAIEAFPVLGRRMNQVAGTLSGGEQQMLAVVRAYTQDPKLVLIDEPSLGLAPVIVDEIFQFLTDLKKAGTSLLVVDQFINRILPIADHVYVMRRGRIVRSGEPRAMTESGFLKEYLGG